MNGRVNTREHGLISEVWAVCATAYTKKLHQLDEHFKIMSISCDAQLEKIHQLQQENDRLKEVNQEQADMYWKVVAQNDKLKQQATGWWPLLEEVLKNDAAFGKLPVKLIDKIKKYLYGE